MPRSEIRTVVLAIVTTLVALGVAASLLKQPSFSSAPDDRTCQDFTHVVVEDDRFLTCEVLWCEKGSGDTRVGGLTVLKCDSTPISAEKSP